MRLLTKSNDKLDVLLVEDNPADVRFVQLAMALVTGVSIEIKAVPRLTDAIRELEARSFDVVLLDLGLPDSRGLETFSVLHTRFRLVPIVVLSALSDDATMFDAVRLGAQDYLYKGDFDAALLVRVVRHAIERHRLVVQLERSLAYVRSLLQTIGTSKASGEPGDTFIMCAWCKRLRGTSGQWEPIEEFLAAHAQAPLTHETCPDCVVEIKREAWDDKTDTR
jgi:DNA-binding NarL/FixJ family response regulator